MTMTCGSVEIGDFSYLAPNCTIMNGKKLGTNCKIGIGSLVMTDVPEGKTFIGRPAFDLDSKRR